MMQRGITTYVYAGVDNAIKILITADETSERSHKAVLLGFSVKQHTKTIQLTMATQVL